MRIRRFPTNEHERHHMRPVAFELLEARHLLADCLASFAVSCRASQWFRLAFVAFLFPNPFASDARGR